jgi:hypothetical protein
MEKRYVLIHNTNGKEHVVDQKTYDILKQRGHLNSYTLKSEREITKQNEYVPAEVRSMSEKKVNSQKETSTEHKMPIKGGTAKPKS